MVMSHTGVGERCFVLRPDVCVHWRQSLRLGFAMAAVCLGIGAAFALLGFWPVLAFAGAESLALVAALYFTGRRGRDTEVVRLAADRLTIEKGRGQPQRCWRFQRAWSEVLLQGSGHPWYPSRLLVRSAGQRVELGAFLNDAERRRLARALQRCVGPMAGQGDGAGVPTVTTNTRRVGDGLA